MDWKVSGQHSNELKHYGVKGMRWGVRKEYELKGRKKATGFSIKDQSIRTEVGTVNIKGFSEKEKENDKWILDRISENVDDRYAPIEEAQKKLNELPRETMAYTRGYNQVSLVNHNGPYYDRLINCFECSMAYEMRKRGYNVQANEVPGGFGVEAQHAFDIKDGFSIQIGLDRKYDGNKSAAAKEAYNQIAKQCLSYGEGARGCIGVSWAEPYDGGHSMYWVVENGEFKIIDSQDSRRDGDESFLDADVVDKSVTVYRLDNAEILPGVTDFVEPYSTVTETERADAAETAYKKKTQNLARVQAQKKNVAEQSKAERMEDAREKIEEQVKNVKKGKGIVANIISNISRITSDLVSNGKETLKKIFNIQRNEPVVTRTTTSSNVTWEVK